MNDEIKEILDDIKDYSEHEYLPPCCELTNEECKHLLDYITKLQEDVRTGQEINSELQQENEDYKSRLEKAIEHIEEIWKSAEGGNIYAITIVGLIRADLLNILQNGSDRK